VLPPDVPVERRKFSRVQMMEATAAAVLAAAIIGTAGGVSWLVIQLPNRLQQLENRMDQIVENQELFSAKFVDLEKQVQEHDRRIIRLELQ
jgi:hypothetical protein